MSANTLTRRRLMGLVAGSLAVAAVSPVGWAQSSGDPIVVLLNARNPTRRLSQGQLKNLYLGNVAFWNGVVPVKLFVRPAEAGISKMFYDEMLKMSAQRFDSHWTSRQLAGKGVPPEVVPAADALAEKIRSVPGGIGIMLASEAWDAPPDGVRILELS